MNGIAGLENTPVARPQTDCMLSPVGRIAHADRVADAQTGESVSKGLGLQGMRHRVEASGGRLEMGIGAAWNEPEFRMYGIPFPSAADRIRQMDEACQVLKALWTEISFPTRWHYDILWGLDYLRRARAAPDERISWSRSSTISICSLLRTTRSPLPMRMP